MRFSQVELQYLLENVEKLSSKELLLLNEYLKNPLWSFKPRPDQPELHDEQTSFIFNQDPGMAVLSGGNGCLAPEQEIFDPVANRYIRVGEQQEPFHVYALSAQGERVIAEAEVPYLKGIADLYEVTLSSGERFRCTLEHRLLSCDSWQTVWDCTSWQSPLVSSSEPCLSELRQDARNCRRIVAGCSDGCLRGCCQCGEQPLEAPDNDLSFSPSLDGVLEHNHYGLREDDQATLPKHNHACQQCDHLSRNSSLQASESQSFSLDTFPASRPYSQLFEKDNIPHLVSRASRFAIREKQVRRLALGKSSQICTVQSSNEQERVCVCSCAYITSITYLRKGAYFDFGVKVHHNYELAGIFHHNSAKTYSGAVKMARLLLTRQPPRQSTDVWLLSTNFANASRNMWGNTLSQFIDEKQIESIKWYSQSLREPEAVTLKPSENGKKWVIHFKSAESSENKLMGHTVYALWIDEYVQFPIVLQAMKRVRICEEDGSTPIGNTWWTMTPEIIGPELPVMYEDRRAYPNWFWYHCNTELNTYVPENYVETIKSNNLSERWPTLLWGCLTSTFKGAIYYMFKKEHIRPHYDIKPHFLKVIAIDPGIGEKFAAIWAAYDPDNDTWIIADEYCDERATLQQHAEAIRARQPDWIAQKAMIFFDPARSEIKLELNLAGLTCYSARREFQTGINEVRSYMDQQKFIILEHCTRTIEELKRYTWHPLQTGHPIKENDDFCFVPGTLITTEQGQVPIEEIEVGDKVLTRTGWKRVTFAGPSRIAELATIHLSDGRTLTGTLDHPVWSVNKGWMPLYLLKNQTLMSLPTWNQSSGTVRDTDDTHNLSEDIIGSTGSEEPKRGLNTCTGKSGERHMGKYQRVCRFTTRTETQAITNWITSNVSQLKTIMPDTMQWEVMTMKSKELIWKRFDLLHRTGIHPQQEEPGTKNTPEKLPGTLNPRQESVEVVPLSSLDTKMDIVATHVNPEPGENHGLITSCEPAPTAIRNSVGTSMPKQDIVVHHVQQMGTGLVYALTVEDEHEYFANGILVRNCDAVRYAIHSFRSYIPDKSKQSQVRFNPGNQLGSAPAAPYKKPNPFR